MYIPKHLRRQLHIEITATDKGPARGGKGQTISNIIRALLAMPWDEPGELSAFNIPPYVCENPKQLLDPWLADAKAEMIARLNRLQSH